MKVTSSTRTGMVYQCLGRGRGGGGIALTYTIAYVVATLRRGHGGV
jgi:hypothetical protein